MLHQGERWEGSLADGMSEVRLGVQSVADYGKPQLTMIHQWKIVLRLEKSA